MVLAVFAVAFSAFAEQMPMIDSQGNISLVESPGRTLSLQEKEAYESPGKEVGFGMPDIFYEQVDYFHLQKFVRCPQTIVYDGKQIKVSDKQFTAAIGDRFLAYHLIALLAIVLLMVGNNYCQATAQSGRKLAASFILVWCAALCAFMLLLITMEIQPKAVNFQMSLCMICTWMVCAFMPAALDEGRKAYWISSALFYVSAISVFLVACRP